MMVSVRHGLACRCEGSAGRQVSIGKVGSTKSVPVIKQREHCKEILESSQIPTYSSSSPVKISCTLGGR